LYFSPDPFAKKFLKFSYIKNQWIPFVDKLLLSESQQNKFYIGNVNESVGSFSYRSYEDFVQLPGRGIESFYGKTLVSTNTESILELKLYDNSKLIIDEGSLVLLIPPDDKNSKLSVQVLSGSVDIDSKDSDDKNNIQLDLIKEQKATRGTASFIDESSIIDRFSIVKIDAPKKEVVEEKPQVQIKTKIIRIGKEDPCKSDRKLDMSGGNYVIKSIREAKNGCHAVSTRYLAMALSEKKSIRSGSFSDEIRYPLNQILSRLRSNQKCSLGSEYLKNFNRIYGSDTSFKKWSKNWKSLLERNGCLI